jgi:hypothetical protein
LQLEAEIAKFKAENQRMDALRVQHESAAKDLLREKSQFEQEMGIARAAFKEHKQVSGDTHLCHSHLSNVVSSDI